MAEFIAKTALDYVTGEKVERHAEPGDTVADLPERFAHTLLHNGSVELVLVPDAPVVAPVDTPVVVPDSPDADSATDPTPLPTEE